MFECLSIAQNKVWNEINALHFVLAGFDRGPSYYRNHKQSRVSITQSAWSGSSLVPWKFTDYIHERLGRYHK